jgi:hypothetical protein
MTPEGVVVVGMTVRFFDVAFSPFAAGETVTGAKGLFAGIRLMPAALVLSNVTGAKFVFWSPGGAGVFPSTAGGSTFAGSIMTGFNTAGLFCKSGVLFSARGKLSPFT